MAEAILYRIPNWDDNFENNRSRTIKHLMYVMLPNKHDSEGYLTVIQDHPNGPSHYACWAVITQVASRCQPRGTLVRGDGTPYDAGALARRTQISTELFEEALPRLVAVGWLITEVVTLPSVTTHPCTKVPGACGQSAGKVRAGCGQSAGKLNTEGKGREGKEGKGRESARDLDTEAFVEFWSLVPRKEAKDRARKAHLAARRRLCTERGWKPEQARAFLAERMAAFASTPKAQGKFCPHTATWLNDGRYDDDPAAWQRGDDDGKRPPSAFHEDDLGFDPNESRDS